VNQFAKNCRVKVTSVKSNFRNKFGTVVRVDAAPDRVFVRLDGHRKTHLTLFDTTELYGLQNPSPLDYREPSLHKFARSDISSRLDDCPCKSPYQEEQEESLGIGSMVIGSTFVVT
jgi:hypothetical protein